MNKNGFLYKLFNDMYEVTLYFDSETDSMTSETYTLKHISKITDTYLKGVDADGLKIEFRSVKPFDYKIKKLY